MQCFLTSHLSNSFNEARTLIKLLDPCSLKCSENFTVMQGINLLTRCSSFISVAIKVTDLYLNVTEDLTKNYLSESWFWMSSMLNELESWLNPGSSKLHFLYKHHIRQQHCNERYSCCLPLACYWWEVTERLVWGFPLNVSIWQIIYKKISVLRKIYFVTWGCVPCISHSMQITRDYKDMFTSNVHSIIKLQWDTLLIYSENFTPRL